MSDYDAGRIYKPSYFSLSHLKTGFGKREPYVIGFDSEAEHGRPFLYQFAHPDGSCDLVKVNARGPKFHTLFVFLDYIREHCRSHNVIYLVFGFNLQYEFTQLFRDCSPGTITASEFTLQGEAGDYTFQLDALNDKRYSFTVQFGSSKRRIRIIDAMAFFPMSLDRASKAIGIGAKKPKPKNFTRRAARTPDFIAYAMQDAILTQKLGQYIVDLHREHDVSISSTAPHFASKTFRRKFLETEIEMAHPLLEQFGLDSYHGGKNGFYLDKPMQIKTAHHVDIRSAYPEAMKQLPDLENGEWNYSEEYIPNVHAIWEIEAIYHPCKYKCLLGKTQWLEAGPIKTRITSYELDSVINCGEIELLSCEGYVFTGPNGGALARYVDEFYTLKRDAKNDAERTAAKLFLNSLYGKFFQKVPNGSVGSVDVNTLEFIRTDPTQNYDYTAGGLYHPAFASLITGYVRAKIHGLEHKYQSVMTSTDGFFSYDPPPPETMGNELGQLSSEPGTLKIWRERLYIFEYVENGKKKVIAALHGWRGTIAQLKRVPLTAGNLWTYYAMEMVTLKMSLQTRGSRRYEPGEFHKKKFTLKLAESPPIMEMVA